MSHEISFKDGQAEAIYSGQKESVWHRLGRYFGDKLVSLADLRECVGIPVEKLPLTYEKPIGNGDSITTVSEKAFVTVRMDTGAELASVGPGYTVVQHDQALVQAIEPIIEAGLATIDAAGLLYGGLAGWSLLKWNTDKMDKVVQEIYKDEIQAYGLCLSWHGEGNANTYANVTERAVCKNTINIGMASATLTTKVFHRKNAVAAQFDAAQQTFRHVIAHHKTMAEAYKLLQSTVIGTPADFQRLVIDPILTDPRKDETLKDAPRIKLLTERYIAKRHRIYRLWTDGIGHSGNRSAWEAYNGLVQSLDHDTDMWKARSDENRALSLTDGPLAKVRQSVFTSLLKYAQHSNNVSLTA